MTKIKQNVILFIEPNDVASNSLLNIGNLYTNRFAIDEDSASEIVKIYYLQKDITGTTIDQEEQKGTDRVIIINFINNESQNCIRLKKF